MKTGKDMIRKGLAITLVSGSLVLPHTSSAVDLSISDVPLFLSVTAEPNIMFILDDSGSMHWEIMPDENRRGAEFTYPTMVSANAASDPSTGITLPSTRIYNDASDYDFDTASFQDGEPMTSWARSIRNNTLYYNPATRYDPWPKGDGTAYPAASITCAPHNPHRTSRGCRNLTVENEQEADWYTDDSIFLNNVDRKFWPALYYNWTNADGDNDPWNPDNYDRVEIKSSTATYTDDSGWADRSGRSDCASAPSCTYAEEIQNFANWYTYYRSRVLLARAGVGNAFDRQGGFLRAGFGAINKGSSSIDGSSIDTIIKGVRKFENTGRTDFFTNLYGHQIPTAGTPLRTALEDSGEYYSRGADTESSPWDGTPGDSSDTVDELSCRQAYTILMTDGYWNGTNPGLGNVDGTSTTSTVPEEYTATNAANRYVYPYRDTHSDTLADMAMRYWYTDLRTDLDNKVPVTAGTDEAYWQHMVTFTVGLGVTGTLNPDTDLPALTGDPDATPAVAPTLFWPNPTAGNAQRIDDMWHAAVNSRGGFFSAADPEEFADALSDTLINIAGRTSSASAVAANSTRISSETLIYQARFNSGDWTGQLLAYPINADGSIGSQEWDASTRVPGEASRNVYSHNGTNGIVFEWANLSATQQADLNQDYSGTPDTNGSLRVDYIRGDQVNDGTLFRNRSGRVLGDIINSDPFFIQHANYGYQALSGNSGNEGLDYNIFRSAANYLARAPMLYVGANDGMLHAFNADSNLDTSVTPNTGDVDAGIEQFAYIPSSVIPKLKNLTSSLYQHEFFVDASPKANDAYLPDAGTCPLGIAYTGSGYCWKTVLLGATGAGAKSIFALDVTDPANFDAGKVMWEFSHAELGHTIGQPTIVRLDQNTTGGHPGWYAVFGNGYNSTSQKAQLFIVELANPANFTIIDTGVGSVVDGEQNGLATPIPVDVNGDRITDAIYAADLHGNIWKFDVDTTDGTSTWRIPFDSNGDGTGTAKPLFQACTASTCTATERQAITTRPNVGRHPYGGVMVYVGTGRYFVDGDNIVPASPQMQTFYGVRDIGNGAADYVTNSRDGLAMQTIEYEITSGTIDYRINSSYTVDYSTQRGWYLDLMSPNNGLEGERVISPALLRFDRVIFTTAIPSADACDFGGSGWLMELDAISGSNLSYAVIDINGDGVITGADVVNDGTTDRFVSGKKLDGLGDPGAIITAGDTEYKYISTSTGQINVTTEQSGGAALGRQAWRQLQ